MVVDGDRVGVLVARGCAGAAGSRGRGSGSRFGFLLFLADVSYRLALEEGNALLLAGSGDEDVLVGNRKAGFFEHSFGGVHSLARILIVKVNRDLRSGLTVQLPPGELDDLRIRILRSLPVIAEDHLTVALGNLLPRADHDVVKGLLEVELTDRGHRGGETAAFDDLFHGGRHVGILVKDPGVAHHLGVCREGSSRHGGERNERLHPFGLRRHVVVFHALLEDLFSFSDLLDIYAQIIVAVPQRMPECDDVRLGGAPRYRSERAIDLIGAGLDRGHIAGDAGSRGLVRVEHQLGFLAEELSGSRYRLMDGSGRSGTGSVLEYDRIVGDSGVENAAKGVDVELRCVRLAGNSRG